MKQDKKKEVEADEGDEDVKGGRQWSRSAPSPPEEGTGSSYLEGGTGSSYLEGGTGSSYLGSGTGSSYLVSSPASRWACSSAHLLLLLVLLIRTIVQA
jgi:Ca2+-binding RTX toxin-like protein